jgi:hypothetical protein
VWFIPGGDFVDDDFVAKRTRQSSTGAAPSLSFGRSGHLQCTCPGFEYRGECKHVRDVRKTALAN